MKTSEILQFAVNFGGFGVIAVMFWYMLKVFMSEREDILKDLSNKLGELSNCLEQTNKVMGNEFSHQKASFEELTKAIEKLVVLLTIKNNKE